MIGARANGFWRRLRGRGGEPSTGPALSDQDDEIEERLISVAERHVSAPEPAVEAGGDATPTLADDAALPYRLHVLDGVHAGAALELDEGPLRIAAEPTLDPSPDIILSDLQTVGSAEAFVLSIENGAVRGPGEDDQPMAAPCELTIGGVRIAIEAATSEARQAARQAALRFAAASPQDEADRTAAPAEPRGSLGFSVGSAVAGLALAVMILGATAPLLSDGSEPPQAALAAMEQSELDRLRERLAEIAPGLSASPDWRDGGALLHGVARYAERQAVEQMAKADFQRFPVSLEKVESPEQAVDALRDRLKSGGLSEALTVDYEANETGLGRVIVTGALPQEKARFWSDMAAWYARRYGAALTLEDGVEIQKAAVEGAPRIGLQAVWVGENPYLIAADGQRRRPGDTLRGGWRITDITPERVRLERDGERHDLRLPGAAAQSVAIVQDPQETRP